MRNWAWSFPFFIREDALLGYIGILILCVFLYIPLVLFQYALLWKGERKLGKGSVCTYGLIMALWASSSGFYSLVVLSFFITLALAHCDEGMCTGSGILS